MKVKIENLRKRVKEILTKGFSPEEAVRTGYVDIDEDILKK